jgi:hypothetical protein
MKSDVKLLEIKGIKTPNFAEPKGELFRQAMNEINAKVEAKRSIKNNSISTITQLKSELAVLKSKQVMAEDEFEEMAIKKRRKEVQEQLDNTDDYSALDVEAFAKKLVSNPVIQKLHDEAIEECRLISGITEEYAKALKMEYERSIKETNRFNAGMGSDSDYRIAAIKYNEYISN